MTFLDLILNLIFCLIRISHSSTSCDCSKWLVQYFFVALQGFWSGQGGCGGRGEVVNNGRGVVWGLFTA